MGKRMSGRSQELREKGSDTEKITINLGYVDLGRIDLLVREQFYSNRSAWTWPRTCPIRKPSRSICGWNVGLMMSFRCQVGFSRRRLSVFTGRAGFSLAHCRLEIGKPELCSSARP
jgi:hypothetical protein